MQNVAPGFPIADEAGVSVPQPIAAPAIDKQPIEQVEKVIARGAMREPLGRKGFVVGQDFLDDCVQIQLRFVVVVPSATPDACARFSKYRCGSSSPSGMIDP